MNTASKIQRSRKGTGRTVLTKCSASYRDWMGKGRFIMDTAALHPDINYIGIERYSSVLLRALQKMEQNPLPNIKFICMDAADVAEVFAKDEVDRIYLNFSDPWPKDRHAKRRLTSRQFFARYDQILKKKDIWNLRLTIRIFSHFH